MYSYLLLPPSNWNTTGLWDLVCVPPELKVSQSDLFFSLDTDLSEEVGLRCADFNQREQLNAADTVSETRPNQNML